MFTTMNKAEESIAVEQSQEGIENLTVNQSILKAFILLDFENVFVRKSTPLMH